MTDSVSWPPRQMEGEDDFHHADESPVHTGEANWLCVLALQDGEVVQHHDAYPVGSCDSVVEGEELHVEELQQRQQVFEVQV